MAAEPPAGPGGQPATDAGARRLWSRLVGGERGAFERVYRDHHQELYRFCLAILRDPHDAEDAMQSTMSKALAALPGERREIPLRPWLFRVAYNESISALRGSTSEPGSREPDESELPSAPPPEELLDRRDRVRALVADLTSLPERQRGALVMRELSGLSYGEIAAALDSKEGAARQIVYEARSALHDRMEGRAMRCETVCRAIDSGDGRRLRARRINAHLETCESCRTFRLSIEQRRTELAALCPPLPLAAASGILAALGGGSTGSAAAGGSAATAGAAGSTLAASGAGTASGVAGTIAAKGASVVAAVVVAAGTADATGVVELPGPPGGSEGSRLADEIADPAASSPAGTVGPRTSGSGPTGDGADGAPRASAKSAARSQARERPRGRSAGAGPSRNANATDPQGDNGSAADSGARGTEGRPQDPGSAGRGSGRPDSPGASESEPPSHDGGSSSAAHPGPPAGASGRPAAPTGSARSNGPPVQRPAGGPPVERGRPDPGRG